MQKFRFKHHIIDTTLPKGLYAHTMLVDVDNDGTPEFITGQQYGTIFLYKYRSPEKWDRYILGTESPSDVAAAPLDVDGYGDIDVFSCEMEDVPGDSSASVILQCMRK